MLRPAPTTCVLLCAALLGCRAGTARFDTADTGASERVRLESSGVLACADPSAREEAVFDLVPAGEEPPKVNWLWGGGALVGDLSGNGAHDVLLPGFWQTFLYEGSGGGFTERTELLRGIGLAGSSGGSLADYDGDGDLDVLITRYLLPDVLLRNDGGVLVDVSREAGLVDQPYKSMATSWGDYDRDGDLDLWVGSYGVLDQSREDPEHDDFEPADPSVLYRNDGDGRFTDVSHLLPRAAHDGYTFSGGFVDVDGDGWLDLYIVNDFGNSYPNTLLRNREGVFEADPEAGLDIAITGMGVGIGDLNADGLPDFVMSAWNGNHVLQSSQVGWVDYSALKGIDNDLERTQKVGWGVTLADLDNDGDLDAPMVYGHLEATYQSSRLQPDALYLQGDDGLFTDVGAEWNFHHPTVGRGFVVADLDGNGWLDVVKRDLAGPTLLYLARCGEASWLGVRLHDAEGANRFAVGARVEVVVGDEVRWRTVVAGTENHASGGPPEVHVGLGDAETVDLLRVTWPDGEVTEHEGIPARQWLDLTRVAR
jgi:hypothetical protein